MYLGFIWQDKSNKNALTHKDSLKYFPIYFKICLKANDFLCHNT